MYSKKIFTFSMLLMGLTSMVSQIVFLREFLIVFYGNEVSIGIILASWLIWGAFGSFFLGRFSDYIKNKISTFAFCQLSLAVILPLTLFFIRASKSFMNVSIGEITGYGPMALSTFLILFFSCSIMGFMFSLGCRIYQTEGFIPSEKVARVYVLEAVGALVGGMTVSYFLIKYMSSFGIIYLVAILNVLAFSFMLLKSGLSRSKKSLFYTLGLIIALAIVLAGPSLKAYSFQRLWLGYDVLESRNSVYGNITVTKKRDQVSFYDNGLNLYTVPDPLSAETSVHYALLECKRVDKVLLIGGGVGGLLEEVLKHPVKRVDYVELDPTIISMAKEYLSKNNSVYLDSPKVNIINQDGRYFTKSTKNKYDVIIISLGDPYTAQLNRFYTVNFFNELNNILDPGGVASFSLTSSENYLSKELADYLSSIYFSLLEIFPDVLIIPGDTAHLLASNIGGVLTSNVDVLLERLENRNIKTLYVRDYYLRANLSKERMNYIKDTIENNKDVKINRDFRPISYYLAILFWSTHFDIQFFRTLMKTLTPANIWIGVIILCIFMFFLIFLGKNRRTKRTVLVAVMTTGFAEIIFQIVVILSFQVIYGYVFYKLGVIITSFMVGLALGGYVMGENLKRVQKDIKIFKLTQCAIILYPLILPLLFIVFSKASSSMVRWIGSNILFPFIPVVAGFIGGVQFPLANKIYLEEEASMGRVAGLTYGLDLLGACLGAFLAAAFLVPVLGIFQTCFLTAFINFIILVFLVFSNKRPTK